MVVTITGSIATYDEPDESFVHASTKVAYRQPAIMTSAAATKTKTYRAACVNSTKLIAAVSFGAFQIATPPPPPETTGYASDSPRVGEHSAPVVAIARARPCDLFLVRLIQRARPFNKQSQTTRPTQRRVHGSRLGVAFHLWIGFLNMKHVLDL